MQVSEPNDVKIYNLSAGKSLPEWLSERKRRELLKKNVDIKRRIELIQDFDMPGLSSSIKVSKDGNYVLACGIYKPRVKCFDVNNLSLKFERCFDSEVITFEILSDDYSKMVFLQCDRYIEFHAAYGRYFRLRIPKFGRDMKYHYPSCDLFIVGASPEVYRLNLERGQFMTSYNCAGSEINKCAINPVHNLLVCGTQEGRVEAWDPRAQAKIGELDCAFACANQRNELQGLPSISALKFNDALHMGVGTTTGQVLVYDIRSNKPLIVKDHFYELPIKHVDFHYQQNLIYSLDSSVLKIWDKNDGKLYTSIEASTEFNDLCLVPKTGLFFLANENTKIQTYYVPSLGPAPKWASFLDSLTEELEESSAVNVYDDYKFVTKQELESLGLDHLVGTKLLRAYMHGYFLDVRLYKKAKSLVNPFEFEKYLKTKIKETIKKETADRVHLNKLPKVNKELALKLMDDQSKNAKKKDAAVNILNDGRFTALFQNPDFEVDKNADEYRLLNPVLSKLNKSKQKVLEKKSVSNVSRSDAEELEGINSSEEDFDMESSDDEHVWTKEVKKEHRRIQNEHRARERDEDVAEQSREYGQEIKLRSVAVLKTKNSKASLGKRLENEGAPVRFHGSVGNREMTFSSRRKHVPKSEERNKKHFEERKKIARSAFRTKSSRNFRR